MKHTLFAFLTTVVFFGYFSTPCRALNARNRDAKAESTAESALLLIEAYNPDGTAVTNTELINSITTYWASDKWAIYRNYGIFRIGTPPVSKQIGSPYPFPIKYNGRDYNAFNVPSNQPFYFTCLWKANGIGSVYMRADNEGRGYVLSNSESHVLQLPYEFALSEYQTAKQIFSESTSSGMHFSSGLTGAISRAYTFLKNAQLAANPSDRAIASYKALAEIMPAKERLVMEVNDVAIARMGHRSDFILNYEGFGDWTDNSWVPNYRKAKQAGFTSVYTICDWNIISPIRGTYNFASMDAQIDQALSLGFAVHLGVNISVNQMPQWAANLPFNELTSLYYENARIVVDRYKDKVAVMYAIGEPELGTNGYTMERIAELIRQSLNGARVAAPLNSFGIYLSAAAYVGYQLNREDQYTLFSSWDLVKYLSENNIDYEFIGLEMQYATVFAPVDMQRIQELLVDFHNLAQKPIYIGETGYSSKSEDYGITNAFYWHEGLTQKAQAEWADGFLRISYANPFIRGLYWVHIADDIGNGSDFLSSLVGCSLIRQDFLPKAAYFSFQNFMAARSGPPAKATLISPGGRISTTTPTYTWNAVLWASKYYLWVNDASGLPRIQQWYTADQAGCTSGAGTCSVSPTVVLAAGAGQWWVQTRNDAGSGPWSNPLSFTVSVGVPAKATLNSPSGNISTVNPSFTWNAVSGASWYYIWVNDSSSSPRISQWFTAAQAGCAAGTGTCSVTPSTSLSPGPAMWWVQTWNDAGYGPWSDGLTFSVSPAGGTPGAATLISPSGTISTKTPSYSWNAVSSATWYLLWVNDSEANPRIQQWFTSDQAGCTTGSGTCSVALGIALSTGAAQWWIQTWNSQGYGPWSARMSFAVP